MQVRAILTAALATVLIAGAATADDAVFKSSTKGTPKLATIDAISFAPGGVLLVADGQGGQILAVQTGDTTPGEALAEPVADIQTKLAAAMGTTKDGIEILDLTVNPISHTAYIAVRKQDDKRYAVLTVDAKGTVGEFVVEDVTYARIALPKDSTPVSKVTDVAWAGKAIVAGARANDAFASKLFSVSTPVEHEAAGNVASAETYHVAHGRWETRAPMSVVLPFVENDETYIVGAFSCTPVVRYPVSAIESGAKVKGTSVLELGSGNRPLNMFSYEKDGKRYVLANTFRFHHSRRPFGPSPYWTVKFDAALLGASELVNETATRRLGKDYEPATERVSLVEPFHGVVHMDKLDDSHALVMKLDDNGQLDLLPLALP